VQFFPHPVVFDKMQTVQSLQLVICKEREIITVDNKTMFCIKITPVKLLQQSPTSEDL